MTSKAYKDMPSSAAKLSFTNQGVSRYAYYNAIGTFHEALIPIVDFGGFSVWQSTNTTFFMATTYGPNISKAQMDSLLKSIKDKLDRYNMNYSRFKQAPHRYTLSYVAVELISHRLNSIRCERVSHFPRQLQGHESFNSGLRHPD